MNKSRPAFFGFFPGNLGVSLQAEKLKGEGDAEAVRIYAQAYEKDPEFYSFVRTLEAYGKSLGRGTTVVLPSNSEFFQYFSPPAKE